MGGISIPAPSKVALPAFAALCHASEADALDILDPHASRIHFHDEATGEFTAK